MLKRLIVTFNLSIVGLILVALPFWFASPPTVKASEPENITISVEKNTSSTRPDFLTEITHSTHFVVYYTRVETYYPNHALKDPSKAKELADFMDDMWDFFESYSFREPKNINNVIEVWLYNYDKSTEIAYTNSQTNMITIKASYLNNSDFEDNAMNT